MTDLTMIVPSRGRPDSVKRTVNSMAETMIANTRLIVVIDIDDPLAGAYVKALDNPGPWASLYVQSGAKKLNPILNYVAPMYAPFCDYIGFMGDDHVPRSVGWDDRLISAIGPMAGVAYADDLLQSENLPTSVVMSAVIVRALGYMAPPRLWHMYMDNFWKQLGNDLGNLNYCSAVVIEHLHPFAGKAASDEGYQRVNAQEVYDHDSAAYHEFLENQWPADLTRLRMVIDV